MLGSTLVAVLALALQTGTVAGTVTLDGTRPQRGKEDPNEECKCLHKDTGVIPGEREIVNKDMRIQNVFVWVSKGWEGRKYPIPDRPALLDQVGCLYRPRVQGIRAGQLLLIRNSDPVGHNVKSDPVRNPPGFNPLQPKGAEDFKVTFQNPEMAIQIGCNIHNWMRAYVHVMAHPYFATTDKDGAFTLPPLPTGSHEVSAWHEIYGELRPKPVTVKEGETAKLEFVFEKK